MNDEHMRVSGADVILYRQASTAARRCRGEAGVAESQRSGRRSNKQSKLYRSIIFPAFPGGEMA
jgi:hypothetical protein